MSMVGGTMEGQLNTRMFLRDIALAWLSGKNLHIWERRNVGMLSKDILIVQPANEYCYLKLHFVTLCI